MNKFKSIVKTDRYGVEYVKNFTIWHDGGISLQRWDSNNPHAKNINLEKIRQRSERRNRI